MASSALDLRTCAAAGKGLRVSAWIIAGMGLIVLWGAFDLGAYSNLILTGLFLATGILLLKPALGARNADLFHPACLFPAIYCFWFGIGSLDILPASLNFRLFEPIPLRMWGYYAIGLAGYILAVGFKQKEILRQHRANESVHDLGWPTFHACNGSPHFNRHSRVRLPCPQGRDSDSERRLGRESS